MKNQNATIMLHARLPICFKEKDKWVVALCPVLDVASQGETKEKAEENLREAIELFLITCWEDNVLDDVLKECGFQSYPETTFKEEKEIVADPIPNNQSYLDIPLPFLAQMSVRQPCHA